MCPSFSLCACRILKIRSCLRSPLAPGSSKDRAILVSSVMFFSFSSAMVIFTYGNGFLGRGSLRIIFLAAVRGTRRGRLSSPPLRLGKIFRLAQNVLTLGFGDPVKDFVHCFLDTGIGLVEPARRLRSELAQHISVSQGLQRIKYAIRAHFRSFSSMIDFGQTSHHRPQGLTDGLVSWLNCNSGWI